MRIAAVLLALVAGLAVIVWFGVPALVETQWARGRVQNALARHTGRAVELGEIEFDWLEGLEVRHVVVRQRPHDLHSAGPFIQVDALALDVSLFDLLQRRLRVEDFTVRRPEIVVIRDENGRFNFADLLEHAHKETKGRPSGEGGQPEIEALLRISDGRLLYIDQPLGTRLDLAALDGEARWRTGRLRVESRFTLNDGPGKLAGTIDLSRRPSPFRLEELSIDGAQLHANLELLGYLVPLIGLEAESASGTFGVKLEDLAADGVDWRSVQRTLSGKATIELRDAVLESRAVSRLLGALRSIGARDFAALASRPQGEDLAIRALEGELQIEKGLIRADDMHLRSAAVGMSLSGWTALDGRMQWQVSIDNLDQLLPMNGTIEQLLGGAETLPLALGGTLAQPKVTVALDGATKEAMRRSLEREAAERIGETLPERMRRFLPGSRRDAPKQNGEGG